MVITGFDLIRGVAQDLLMHAMMIKSSLSSYVENLSFLEEQLHTHVEIEYVGRAIMYGLQCLHVVCAKTLLKVFKRLLVITQRGWGYQRSQIA